MRRHNFVAVALIAFVIAASDLVASDQEEDIPHNEVRNWALKFGVDLWEFGRQFTKMDDIKNKYKDLDGEVIRKDGILLLREMAAEVKNFMDFKMNAVMRLMDSAEQAALSELDRESQQASQSQYDTRRLDFIGSGRLADAYREIHSKIMRRFEGLPVNLSISSLLVPSEVDMTDSNVQSAITWSSHLDLLFANNLERDSALSWQYFGSSTGFLRRFPGTTWPPEGSRANTNINDFRMDDWFVQAASSPKDIMILLDSSGSMSGKSFELGIETASAILDTLGDDDFVNLIAFSESANAVVPCFKDKLVRATPDNLKEIKDAVKAVKCENVANFTAGFEYAFQMLHQYNQTGKGSQCNQAIMLITDGTSESHNEIIKHYNWPHMPVRIFTYLIGGDSGSRETMRTMACTNKGFYVQINTPEEAKKRVIEYALVMARPMVLYQADHPIHWSPVFVGGKASGLARDNDNKRRLVTTVSTPVFDKRNHSVRVANLLGVVGTDVPIEEILKMVPQYKLGVNGYSFIIDNNGRVLYHPDLRPMSDGYQYSATLKPKYNSVDLTEVELPETDGSLNNNNNNNNNHDNDKDSDNLNFLHEMRKEMVNQKEGETEFSVLTHLDGMKRVTMRNLRFYYGPIEGTPFTLALALPEKYGTHELSSQQEIRHSHQNVTEYFKGNNWRVHPDWVYCEYNTLHDLSKERDSSAEATGNGNDQMASFETPEDQVLHFLSRAGRPGWKWMSVRPRSPQPHHAHGAIPVGMHAQHMSATQGGSRKAEPYFCDRTLIQSLVRDAMVTEGLERNSTHTMRKEDKQQGYIMFGVKVSFVATRSGLLRWVDHIEHPENSPEPHFMEANTRAMDASWYKRAVDQHAIEPDSFVFSVPFDSGYTGKNSATLVTATHAIFIEHRGHKAPAAVVGLQFQHESLAMHFRNITTMCTGSSHCKKTCSSDELDCYLLDNNGFVILSESTEHTGRFFGQIDGTIMDSLVQDRIYRRVTLMDYQGVCPDTENPYTATGVRVLRPLHWVIGYVTTLCMNLLALMPKAIYAWPQYEAPQYPEGEGDFEDTNYNDDYNNFEYSPSEEDATIPDVQPERPTPPPRMAPPAPGPRVIPDPGHARPCDLNTDLYALQPERLNSSTPLKGKLTNCHASGCERPFSVQKIPHSNLILLVVDTLCPCGSKQLDIEPFEVPGGSGACGARRLNRERLQRKRPLKCINYHPEEVEIQQCGSAPMLHAAFWLSHLCTFWQVWMLVHA